MNKNVRIGLLLLMVIALIGIPQTSAITGYLVKFNETYGTSGTRLDTCLLCHVIENPSLSTDITRNSYGTAVEGIITTDWSVWPPITTYDFAAIEGSDSDRDGFINGAEINSRTFPGNSSDHPPTSTILGLISCKRCSQFPYTKLIRLVGVDLVSGSLVNLEQKVGEDGFFKFENIPHGVYVIHEVSQYKWWWDSTNYNPITIKIPAESKVFKINFKN